MRILFPPVAPPSPLQADWLAELANALSHCDRLLDELREQHPPGIDATILAARVATMRSEIARLQRGMKEGENMIPPKWIGYLFDAAQTPCGNSPPPPNSTI